MANSFTDAWAEAQASMPTNKHTLVCLEFLHPSFKNDQGEPDSVRVVRDLVDHNLLLEGDAPIHAGQTVTFIGCPFEVPFPEVADSQTPAINIRVDNIYGEVSKQLKEAVKIRATLQVRVRSYIMDLDTGEYERGINPFTFVLRGVTASQDSIRGAATPADLVNTQFARLMYDLQTYPGLNQA